MNLYLFIVDKIDYFLDDFFKFLSKNDKLFYQGFVAGLVVSLVSMLALIINIPVISAITMSLGIVMAFKYEGILVEDISLDLWRRKATFPQVLLVLFSNIFGACTMSLILLIGNFSFIIPTISNNILSLVIKGFVYGFFFEFCKNNKSNLWLLVLSMSICFYFGAYSFLNLLSGELCGFWKILATFIGNFLGVGFITLIKPLKEEKDKKNLIGFKTQFLEYQKNRLD